MQKCIKTQHNTKVVKMGPLKTESNNNGGSGTHYKCKILEHIAFRDMTKLSKETADVFTCCSVNQSTNKYLGWHLSAHNA